jgi:phosphatidylinositol alpha-mannosyltransferase
MPANGSRAPITLSLIAAAHAASVVEAFAPDVVHLHEPFAPLLGYAMLRRHRVASVGTFHRSGGGPAYSLTGPILRGLARGLDECVAVSNAAATTARSGAGVLATVLFNGFETERLRGFPRTRDDHATILFVGRLEERKGVLDVLACARRHATGASAPWRILIAGDGPLRDRVAKEAFGVPGVELLGAVDDATKRRLLRSADVVVAPSTHGESFGLVILEAMAAEARVVVADIDGYREAAGGFATMFQPGDPLSLESAITAALVDRGEATIDAARAHAEAWSMRTLMDRYLEIYERANRNFKHAR